MFRWQSLSLQVPGSRSPAESSEKHHSCLLSLELNWRKVNARKKIKKKKKAHLVLGENSSPKPN